MGRSVGFQMERAAARGSSVAGGAIRSSTGSGLAIPEVDGPLRHVTIALKGSSGGAYSDLAEPPFQDVGLWPGLFIQAWNRLLGELFLPEPQAIFSPQRRQW